MSLPLPSLIWVEKMPTIKGNSFFCLNIFVGSQIANLDGAKSGKWCAMIPQGGAFGRAI